MAVFSQEEQIRERSLKLYTYLVCHSYLRNAPNQFGDNVRIFRQRDINLQEIKRILGFDPDTTKKYWNGLEQEGLIRYCPHDFKEIKFDKNNIPIPFKERWKIRTKHKDTYYEIPITDGQMFRKIPKDTLVELNEIYKVNELTMKIYITLVNYQEISIYNNQSARKFTYQDLRDLLGYEPHTLTNKKMEVSLHLLESLKLIEIDKGNFTNKYGVVIPCFSLRQANFYISYEIKDFETGDIEIISEEAKEKIREVNRQSYPEAFKN